MANQDGASHIQQIMYGFWASKALFTGVELGIFDELDGGPAGAEVLAVRLRLDPPSTERLCNALVGLGLLARANNVYSLTDDSKLHLVRGKDGYLGGQVDHLSRLHWRLWQYLPDAVREGTPRMKQALGPGYDLFEALYQDPQWTRALIQGMHNVTMQAAREIVSAFDLSKYTHLLDVGGGSGALCIAAAQRYPKLHCTVFDLPSVVAVARDYVEQQKLSGSVTVQAGDFFKAETFPEGADAVALAWVLHDWSPLQARTIIRNAVKVLKPGGALLVAEKLLDDERTGPTSTTLTDLHLLVSTGGAEHPASDYETWLRRSGLERVHSIRLSGDRDLVVGYKPT